MTNARRGHIPSREPHTTLPLHPYAPREQKRCDCPSDRPSVRPCVLLPDILVEGRATSETASHDKTMRFPECARHSGSTLGCALTRHHPTYARLLLPNLLRSPRVSCCARWWGEPVRPAPRRRSS